MKTNNTINGSNVRILNNFLIEDMVNDVDMFPFGIVLICLYLKNIKYRMTWQTGEGKWGT